MTTRSIFIGLFILLSSCTNNTDTSDISGSGPFSFEELSKIVESTRQKHGLPALGVLIQTGKDAPIVAVSGVRKLGNDQRATISDLWHIGSTAKSMTASLLATFVQQQKITFESTLFELFPEYADSFTPETKLITLDHLLSHRSGFKPNPAESQAEFEKLFVDINNLHQQRKKALLSAISEKLLFLPGSDFSYSNTGYIIAAAVIERLGNNDYETLLNERVLNPLHINHFGFGAPGAQHTGPEIVQPWGHVFSGKHLSPVAPDNIDQHNPQLFNSAGNLHISLTDWAIYARDHLNSRKGEGVILNQVLVEKIDMPTSGESGYSMGWGVLVEDGDPILLTHNGSDGNWFADIRLYPFADIVLLVVTNDGREDQEAKAAARDIREQFNKRYSPFP